MAQQDFQLEQHPLLSVMPLRDVVIFPHMVIPLFVGRASSVHALETAMTQGQPIFLVSQKDPKTNDITANDLYQVGTVSIILQLLKLPDGTIKVLVEGVKRAKVLKYFLEQDYYMAEVGPLEETPYDERHLEALSRTLLNLFEQYVKLNRRIPPELLSSMSTITEPERLIDTIAAHLMLKLSEKQEVLEIEDIKKRAEKLIGFLETEMDLLQVEKRIRGEVRTQIERNQREYYLNEQMKAIQKELGKLDKVPSDFEQYEENIRKAGMSKEAQEKAFSELKKLKMMAPMSAEASVSRNYLDALLEVPWKNVTKLHKNLSTAEAVLEEDHYGLEKVKERIVEYLAVQQRVQKSKGPILCLVGPPGVGKTSLGQSIARATGREFTRMALGGVRDEAEIRGHRRTYIGALPGKIIQKISKTKVKNPLFMLDEIDKMCADFRGDPASALLEVLDPEQNSHFNDHYLEVDYDLSDVMFIATANTLDIPAPLLDRMEVIRLSGYTEDEKVNIALRHLLEKQMTENGVKASELEIREDAIRGIVRHYTREAGVRNLEREISKICRKVTKELLLAKKKGQKKIEVRAEDLEKYLGVQQYRFGVADVEDRIGEVNGLAWTSVGGEMLEIEAAVTPGKGKITLTGQLGSVMQESIQAAITVIKSRAEKLKIPKHAFEKQDIHVHLPEGAIPKDGPSAGVGMCTALASVLTGLPVRADVAMTGEITLRGEVLPIGGLKEKLLAALRGGIKLVLIPKENEKDLKEIPKNIQQGLEIRSVQWVDEVLDCALVKKGQRSLKEAKKKTNQKKSKARA